MKIATINAFDFKSFSFLEKASEKQSITLAKLVHPMEEIFCTNIMVLFVRVESGLCAKISAKFHMEKQIIRAAHVLLSRGFGALYNIKPAMYAYTRRQKKCRAGKKFIYLY